jgi:hypothetical protein
LSLQDSLAGEIEDLLDKVRSPLSLLFNDV